MANKNQLLEKVKKELLHRGQYQEVDQKCQSFKSFINLMETNQLFKELRTDPRKMTGDLARDMQKGVETNRSGAQSSFINGKTGSFYGASIQGESYLDEHARAADSIADLFVHDIAAEFGISLNPSHLSAGTSSAGGSFHVARPRQYLHYSPGD